MNDEPLLLATEPKARPSLDPLVVAIVRALQSIEKLASIDTAGGPSVGDDREARAA